MNLYSTKSFYTMGFTSVILSLTISLVRLLNPFTVFITIKRILNFSILNYPPSSLEFFSLTFYLFFLVLQYHIFFSPLPNASASPWMSTLQLSISCPLKNQRYDLIKSRPNIFQICPLVALPSA